MQNLTVNYISYFRVNVVPCKIGNGVKKLNKQTNKEMKTYETENY
jgi:hypothetical protein